MGVGGKRAVITDVFAIILYKYIYIYRLQITMNWTSVVTSSAP